MLRWFAALQALRNRALNRIATLLTGQAVSVDWRDLKIVHPENIRVGAHFSAGRSIWLESVAGRGRIEIGERVNISDQVHIAAWDRVQIGDGVLLGSRVLVVDHGHGASPREPGFDFAVPPNERPICSSGPVSIGARAWLGDGVCVLAGVSIGEGAIVGANAVVVSDVPPRTVWAGVPARQVWPRPAAAELQPQDACETDAR